MRCPKLNLDAASALIYLSCTRWFRLRYDLQGDNLLSRAVRGSHSDSVIVRSHIRYWPLILSLLIIMCIIPAVSQTELDPTSYTVTLLHRRVLGGRAKHRSDGRSEPCSAIVRSEEGSIQWFAETLWDRSCPPNAARKASLLSSRF